ncbi:MAG: hypothetical protein HQK91_00285 [Nitrospirae bacterium]|nr:hypothetical protein [Nitrospirota bacterium]
MTVKNFIIAFLSQDDITNILGMIVMALLTVLIPIAISILSEIKGKDFEVIDKNVLLNRILNARLFFKYLALVFLPLIFWGASKCWFIRILELIVWGIGIRYIAYILINSYRWMKGDRHGLRLDYLKNLKNILDIEASWNSVWQTEKINTQNERDFFKIFSSKIDDQIEKNESNLISKLLGDFNNFINNRSTVFLIIELFPKVLDWHFEIWKKEHLLTGQKEQEGDWVNYSIISDYLDSILKKTEERALKEGDSYSFFSKFKIHAENHSTEFTTGFYYIESLMDIFYHVFFEQIHSSPKRYNIWSHYFPKEWKFTKVNLEKNDRDNIAWRSLNIFLQWAPGRIERSSQETEPDNILDYTSSNLFPEVDPILWAKILTLCMRSWTNNERMKSLVEGKRNFGIMGRPMAYTFLSEEKLNEQRSKKMELEEDKTFELALYLFEDFLTKDNLNSFIDDLGKLKYEDDIIEKERNSYIAIFEKMISILELKKS